MMTTKRKKLEIDVNRCMGCCACEIACKMEYQLPRGVRFIVMKQSEDPSRRKEKLMFEFDLCRHCDHPDCLSACPTGALYQRDDGIVLVDESSCIGCGCCKAACPWGIPQITDQGKMRKCSMCAVRIDQGLRPACEVACPAEAIRLTEL